jgi:hypothetical protein
MSSISARSVGEGGDLEVIGLRNPVGRSHIELQTEPNADMGGRSAEYRVRLWRRDPLPAHSVVV